MATGVEAGVEAVRGPTSEGPRCVDASLALWGGGMVGTPGLVGRDRELARIAEFLGGTERFPRALLLEGEPGIGKTTLWQAAVDGARERSHRVLVCHPSPAETQVALGALGGLLDDVVDASVGDLPAPQQRALRVALLLEQPDGPPPDQRATFTAVVGLLRRLAEAGPLVIAIDDIHYLDVSTAAALQFVAHRLDALPIALVLAVRSGEAPELVAGLEHGLAHDGLERLFVGPMTLAGVYQVLHQRLGESYSRATLRRIHRSARGNPLLALEIARALAAHGGDLGALDPLPVPTEMRALLSSRLQRLPARTRRALLPVAALAEPTSTILDQVMGPDVWIDLEPAFDAHVLEWDGDHCRFTHPLLASVLYASGSDAERRRTHRRLGQVLTVPDEQARHLALAADGPDPNVADALDRAAERTAARGVPLEAADLEELASRMGHPDDEEAVRQRLIRAAEYHFIGGRVKRSRELLTSLLQQLPEGVERARVLVHLAWSENDLPLALGFAEQALDEATEELELQAAIHHMVAFLYLGMGGIAGAQEHARLAVALAEEAGSIGLLAQGLSVRILTAALAGKPVDPADLDRAMALEEQLPHVPLYYPPALSVGHLLASEFRLQEAEAAFERSLERARETGDEVMQAATLFHWCELRCRRSDFVGASEYGRESYEITRQIGFEGREAPALSALSLALARLGDEETRGFAERAAAIAERYGMATFEAYSRAAIGALELSMGDAEAAVSNLRPLLDLQEGYADPSLCLSAGDAIEAMIAVGWSEEAGVALSSFERRARRFPSSWARGVAARCQGFLAAARDDLEGAIGWFDTALESHRDPAQRYELARALLAQGTTLRRARQHRRARTALTGARDLFEELHVSQWAERAREELERIGGRASSPHELTPAERRVADLVATGLTNKQVAAELFISVHTVETQLSSAYAKLGVHSRTELTHRLMAEHAIDRAG